MPNSGHGNLRGEEEAQVVCIRIEAASLDFAGIRVGARWRGRADGLCARGGLEAAGVIGLEARPAGSEAAGDFRRALFGAFLFGTL